MDAESAAAGTDVVLAGVTAVLGGSLIAAPARRGWAALFGWMAVSAALGAAYHGVDAWRTDALWRVVSGFALATGPAFLWACVTPASRWWRERSRSWPAWTAAGFAVGVALAGFRFYWVSAVAGACVLAAAVAIARTGRRDYRVRVYAGILITAVGLVVQAVLSGPGPWSGNAVFHVVQIAANVAFWSAARRLPAP